jgi:hypothetical protein
MKGKKYIYKTKQGFGGLLKAGLRCMIVTHLFGSDTCVIRIYRKKQIYWGNLKDIERI